MNKFIKYFVVTLSVLMIASAFSGCGKISYDKIGYKLLLDDESITGLMYADDKTLLTSFGKVTNSGNGMRTRGFTVSDIKTGNIENAASVISSCQIPSAIPEEGGIIYVNYSRDDNKNIKWNVIELKNGEQNYILSGECKNTSELPKLLDIGGSVGLVWKDRASGTAGISVISDGAASRLLSMDSSEMVNTYSASGENVAVIYTTDDSNARYLSICDREGNIKKIPIDGKLQSAAVTKDNVIAVIRQGSEPARYRLFKYIVSDDEGEYIELSSCLYDLTGGDGNKALCHDLDGRIYCVDAAKGTLEEISCPEGLDGSSVVFGKIIKNKAVAAFTKDEKCSFYMLNLK